MAATSPQLTIPPELRIDDWLIESLRSGHNLGDYVYAPQLADQRDPAFGTVVLGHLPALVAAGRLELHPEQPEHVRLPSTLVIDAIIGEALVDAWRRTNGHHMLRFAAPRLLALLDAHVQRAVDLDAEVAIYTALGVACPGLLTCVDRGNAAAAVRRLSEVRGDAAALVRTITSVRDFPGCPVDLLDLALAIIA